MTTERPYVLITGVSTGIGFDATRYLIERGYHVLGLSLIHISEPTRPY